MPCLPRPRVGMAKRKYLCWQNSRCAIDIGVFIARCDMATCDMQHPRSYTVVKTHLYTEGRPVRNRYWPFLAANVWVKNYEGEIDVIHYLTIKLSFWHELAWFLTLKLPTRLSCPLHPHCGFVRCSPCRGDVEPRWQTNVASVGQEAGGGGSEVGLWGRLVRI